MNDKASDEKSSGNLNRNGPKVFIGYNENRRVAVFLTYPELMEYGVPKYSRVHLYRNDAQESIPASGAD
jgi:hypothetical protein